MSKGVWLLKDNQPQEVKDVVNWGEYDLGPAELNWDLVRWMIYSFPCR